MARKKTPPYWLRELGDVCSICEGSHSHHAGAHCAACDARLCVVCVEFASGEVLCVSCRPAPVKTKKIGRFQRWRRALSGKA